MSEREPQKPEEPEDGHEPLAAEDQPAPDVETLLAQRDDLLGRLQRVSADYLNYQKRQQRQVAETRDFANAELVRDLLAVLDDMERAMEAAEANHEADDPLLAGMHLVYAKALEVLARHGLSRIGAEGEPFDPLRHEAMLQEPCPQCQAPTVSRELQRGYELKGRVLRPARVVVAVPPEAEQAPPAEHRQPPTEDDSPKESE